MAKANEKKMEIFITIQRALGIIEGVASSLEELEASKAKALTDAVEMLDEVYREVRRSV